MACDSRKYHSLPGSAAVIASGDARNEEENAKTRLSRAHSGDAHQSAKRKTDSKHAPGHAAIVKAGLADEGDEQAALHAVRDGEERKLDNM